jgi:DNA-binding XRE family transcriptional regulator
MLRKNNLRIIPRSLEASLIGLAANSGVSTTTIVSIEKYDV